MGGVGCGLLIERPIPRVLNGQCCDQHQHLLQALPLAAGHEHAAQAGVQGQACKLTAHLGELALAVEATELLEQHEAIGHRLLGGWVDKGKGLDGIQAQGLHAQNHRGQR